MITLRNWLAALLAAVVFLLPLSPVQAARGTDSYDGNIFALYAGDGALVPPRLSLAEALAGEKPIVLAFYLDDSAASKDFAPLLSDLDGRWGRVTEVIALPSDPYSVDAKAPLSDPSHYWRGTVPQLLVLSSGGKVLYDVDGRMDVGKIEQALSDATGIALPDDQAERSSTSFNEINSGYGS